MEAEPIEESDNSLSDRNSLPGKRGRGRPRGSFKKDVIFVKEFENNNRTTKKVDFFSPEPLIRSKNRKRGRPRKIRIPGRPRKIPLTPEEEEERMLRLGRKRKLSKPLGRPRIHPLVIKSQIKRGRGRPRKTESTIKASTQNSSVEDKPTSLQKAITPGEDTPRKRGRPHGSFKKKRGRPPGFSPATRMIDGVPIRRGRPPGSGVKLERDTIDTPRKRGRPPGSGNKVKVLQIAEDGSPRKRGRPPGSSNKVKVIKLDSNGFPRKRGRPPGSGIKVHVKSQNTDGTPRKRGRPPGSGKVKTVASEIEHTDLSSNSSVLYISAQPRKRGRPKKDSQHKVSQWDEDASKEEDYPPSPKQARSSSASETEGDVEDQNSSENEAEPVEESFDDTEELDEREKQALVKNVHERCSRKNVFSRVGGKSQKKK